MTVSSMTVAAGDVDTAISLYRTMALIQRCDERLRRGITSGQAVITYFSPRGQEAISAGVCAAIAPGDYLCTTYRGLHDQIAKGVPLRPLVAEYLGRATGSCGGKGGPMHIADPDVGLMLTTGIVGSGLPIGVGMAFASSMLNDGRVTVVNFGDGASNIGAFHEALNLASVWKLPVVFVCHNNRYAEHTPFAAGTACETVAQRAASYSIPAETVDGNDPDVVRVAASRAVERARGGEGPTLLEALTYRFCGHMMGDDMAYMPAEERQAAHDADPVPTFRARLLADAAITEEALKALEAELDAQVEDAYAFALASDAPHPSTLSADVVAESVTVVAQ